MFQHICETWSYCFSEFEVEILIKKVWLIHRCLQYVLQEKTEEQVSQTHVRVWSQQTKPVPLVIFHNDLASWIINEIENIVNNHQGSLTIANKIFNVNYEAFPVLRKTCLSWTHFQYCLWLNHNNNNCYGIRLSNTCGEIDVLLLGYYRMYKGGGGTVCAVKFVRSPLK